MNEQNYIRFEFEYVSVTGLHREVSAAGVYGGLFYSNQRQMTTLLLLFVAPVSDLKVVYDESYVRGK